MSTTTESRAVVALAPPHIDADGDTATRSSSSRTRRPGGADDPWPGRLAVALLLAATFVAVVALVPPWHAYFRAADDPVSMLTIPIVPSLVYASVLVVVGVAVRRRLVAAWWLLIAWWLVVPAVDRLVALAAGTSVVLASIGLAVSAVALTVMLRAKPGFVAHRAAGNISASAGVLLLGGVVTIVGGAALISAFGTSPSFGSSAAYVYGVMVSDVGRLDPTHVVHVSWWLRVVVDAGGAAVVLASAVLLFRAPRDIRSLGVQDEAQVRALLRDHGDGDSLGYFATRRDKSVVWDTGTASTARAGVSYRAIGSVSLASGNPGRRP